MTIQLVDRRADQSTTHSLRLKIDPGSRTTGLALVSEASATVVWAAELTHRSSAIRDGLLARRAFRSNRRQRHTRYRPARFQNRRRSAGWLAPSLRSRVAHILTWSRRLAQRCPIQTISVELVRFDTQALVDPEIRGVEYQQGELLGYEVREYLLEKWGRTCAYCGATGLPLQVEHIVPRSRGGSNRVSNLTLACEPCNQRKGTQTAAEFGFPHIQAQAQRPLRDAAAVNSTRWALYQALQATGLPIEAGTGSRTKYNRTRLGWPKTHWQDAACVGASTPAHLRIATPTLLQITATGRGLHSRTRLNQYGFPRLRLPRQKRFFGFQTGDMVEASVPSGTKRGRYVGRVAVRASGSFNITTMHGTVQGLHRRFFRVLQRADGYRYAIVRLHHPASPAESLPQPYSSHRSSGGFPAEFCMNNIYINTITAIEPFVAGDGCVLRELLHPARHPVAQGYSLAHAYVEPGGRTADHTLEQSEVYYILSGQGTMFLAGEPHAVAAGSYFYIPARMSQWLRNDGDGRIEFLCIVDPPWTSEGETIGT